MAVLDMTTFFCDAEMSASSAGKMKKGGKRAKFSSPA
jgi:hypothetical protein